MLGSILVAAKWVVRLRGRRYCHRRRRSPSTLANSHFVFCSPAPSPNRGHDGWATDKDGVNEIWDTVGLRRGFGIRRPASARARGETKTNYCVSRGDPHGTGRSRRVVVGSPAEMGKLGCVCVCVSQTRQGLGPKTVVGCNPSVCSRRGGSREGRTLRHDTLCMLCACHTVSFVS